MKKAWKIVGFSLLSVLVILYLAFLLVLPNCVDLNKYKTDVQKIVNEQTNLSLDFEEVKILTTPLLGAGVEIEEPSVKLPDGTLLFSADEIKTRIALPSLLLMTVKVSCLEIEKPFVNLEIANNLNFKINNIIEEIINRGKEEKLVQGNNEKEKKGFKFNPAWIRIKVPNVKIEDYKVLVNDLDSGHYLRLVGEELRLGYFNGKTVKLKTYAELFSDENKNITANLDIKTFLPKAKSKLDEEDDPAERVDIPFVNPVTMYRNYDLKANLDTKIRVRNHRNNVVSYGYLNIDNITLKVMNLILPDSYLHAKTFGNNVNLDTNIYPAKDQNISLLGKLNYGNHPNMDMSIKTASIKFNDLLTLGRAFLDSLHISNELKDYTAYGTFNADCYIKTNFKKLHSSGSILVKDGGLAVRNLGKVLANGNINVKLDNNILDIRNSEILVGNHPLYIDGSINEKSIADINVKAEKISLATLFNAFAPKDVRNQFNFRSGNASINLGVKGKLKEAVASVKFQLDNLNLSNSSLRVLNENLVGEFSANKKDLWGKIDNKNLKLLLPMTNSNVTIPNFNLELADKNILIKENYLTLNDKTKIVFNGNVEDYTKLKNINFEANGSANTNDLIKVIGNEFKPFIHSNGSIPVKLTINGDKYKQTLFTQALCDKNNFITPIDFKNIMNANTSLQSVIDFKPNRIKIKKTGLYKRNISVDEKGNETVKLEEVVGVDGTIEGNRINLIKVTMPKSLDGKIYVFPESNFSLKGRAFIFGESSRPRFRGGYKISNLSIPELLLTLREGNLNFRGYTAEFDLKDLLLNGSDIQLDGVLSLLPDKNINLWVMNVKSRYLNLDKLMVVADKAMKYVPKTPASKQSKTTQSNANIPVMLKDGTIDFNRIILGKIDIKNTHSNITLDNNIFNIRYLRTNIFDGRVRGNIGMNLISTLLNINLHGNGINVEKALLNGANMKDTISGTATFNTDISLKGTTYEEQMRSLKGDVNFNIKNGQFGPFGKVENLIVAENIRESKLFQTALGGVISGLTTIDTTHFSELKGVLSFKDGICNINPITSNGDILSLHIAGDFDLLKNTADMKARARMASLVSNLLGPIGAINPANLVGNAANLNIVTAKAFSLFCELIPEEEIKAIPSFSNKYVDNSATKFQIVIKGDVNKPFSLIKSFKWLATQNEMDKATEFVNSIPEPVEGSEATTIQGVIDEVEAEKKTLKYKAKHMFKKENNAKESNQ